MINLRAALVTALILGASAAEAGPSSLGEPLALSDFGSFFVNGQLAESSHAMVAANGEPLAGHYIRNQMYVQYLIPQTVRGAPLVMVPGAYHNGTTYETTPDGREGWATYFVRQGYPVYLVDQAGRGRSGFDSTMLNRLRSDPGAIGNKTVPTATREAGWVAYRFGPRQSEFWPDSQFPAAALEQYMAQTVPLTENLLDRGTDNTVDALEKLLQKIGPSTLLVHSQSGAFGLDLVRRNPAMIKNLIIIEGNCAPVSAAEVEKFKQVPLLAVFGDHTIGAVGTNGEIRRNGCSGTVSTLKGAGGDATFLLLPDQGIKGNTHLMMMEKNNLQIAGLIRDWLRSGFNGGAPRDQSSPR